MSHLPRIMHEGRISDVALVTLMGIGQAVLMGLGAFATRDIFAALHAASGTPLEAFVTLGAAGAGVAVLQWVARVRAEALGQSYARDLRVVLYRHMAGMSRSDLSEKRIGALSLRFVGDLSAARNWVGLGLSQLCAAIVVLPGAALVLFLLDPRLAVAGVIPVAVALLITLGIAVHLSRAHRRLRSKRARVAINAMERVALAPELDLHGRTDKELALMKDDGEQLKADATARIARASGLRALPQVGAAIGGVAVLWTALSAGIPASNAAGALALLSILVLPLGDLAGVWDKYCAWQIARTKCLAVFAKPSVLRNPAPKGTPVAVHFENVRFRGVHAHLSIPPGAMVRVTGPAGSGKSSLLSLVAMQDRPEQGRIAYDGGTPRIAYITDAANLIVQGSLRRSLTLGIQPRPGTKAVTSAAKAYGLSDVLVQIGGVRGRVAEQGRSLSRGEALRVGLVRARLSQPDVVVIDHSALLLDPERDALLLRLRRDTNATILVVDAEKGMLEAAGELRLDAGVARYEFLNRRPVGAPDTKDHAG